MIRTLPLFLDTSAVSAVFVSKHRKSLTGSGVLPLRHWHNEEAETVADRPVLAEWNSARALLKRIRAEAAAVFGGEPPALGLAWIDHLAPDEQTPWTREDGDYADEIVRLRICLIPSPGAWSFSAQQAAVLQVGAVNVVDHRLPCSEINLGPAPRTHLVVDLYKPAPVEPPAD